MSSATQQQSVSVWRFRLIAALLVCLAALLTMRVLYLQVLDTDRGYQFLQSQGDARTIRNEVIPAYRGVISDRNGETLAMSTPVVSISINPKLLIDSPDRWQELARAIGMPYRQLKNKIENNRQRGFVYLQRHMDPSAAAKVTALNIVGVNAEREYKRFYPAAEVAAHLVGFTNIDDRGQEGMELAFDSWLQAKPGMKRVVKDLRGNVIRDIEQISAAHMGKDLALSIDLRLQHLAYRELKMAIAHSKAKSGSVVMLNVHTGEVLAMANQPSYNPNNRSDLTPSHMRNRAITDVFEPGSTVKPLTVVAALESGQYQPHSVVDTNPGYIRVGSKTLLDPVNYGVIDLTKVLTKSSQVGTSKIALSLDAQDVWGVFHRFGFGESTQTQFPGESAGILPNRTHWRDIERATFAFGYGLSVTPLQLAQAYSVFAAGGILRPVTLLRQEKPVEGQRVVSEKIAGEVLKMLKTVTEQGGTATRAQMTSYSVAGKTGTIHKVGANGYADDRYRAVFAGVAPADNPEVVTVVMIDEPQSGRYYGGEAAAPVFSAIVADALRLMDVAPDKLQTAKESVATRKGGRKSV